MVTLATVARNLVIIAVMALVWAVQTFFWPMLPLGFEGTLALGGLLFSFGAALSIIALVLAITVLIRGGRTPARAALCFSSGAVLACFVVFGATGVVYPL
jgi:hypothetical protein